MCTDFTGIIRVIIIHARRQCLSDCSNNRRNNSADRHRRNRVHRSNQRKIQRFFRRCHGGNRKSPVISRRIRCQTNLNRRCRHINGSSSQLSAGVLTDLIVITVIDINIIISGLRLCLRIKGDINAICRAFQRVTPCRVLAVGVVVIALGESSLFFVFSRFPVHGVLSRSRVRICRFIRQSRHTRATEQHSR